MRRSKSVWRLAGRLGVVLMITLGLAACGGGGGGGSAGGFSYSGLTTPASINSSNASAMAGSAYRTGDAGTSVSIASFATGSAPAPASARSERVATLIKNTLSKIEMPAAGPASPAATVQQEQFTQSGLCGGSFNYTISYDDVTGNFSGTLIFNAYCEELGESISGQMSFSGQISGTGEFISFQVSVTNLSIADAAESFSVSGSIAFSFPSASLTEVTENFDIRDASGKVYRVENFVVTLGNFGSTISLAGRFYHPDYGYVDVQTTTPFDITFGSDSPTSGSLTVTGASSKAVLTVFNGTYQLQIDADGDDTFEETLTGSWTDL